MDRVERADENCALTWSCLSASRSTQSAFYARIAEGFNASIWAAVPVMRRLLHDEQRRRPTRREREGDDAVLAAGVPVHAREVVHGAS